jgi:hypothetical protein
MKCAQQAWLISLVGSRDPCFAPVTGYKHLAGRLQVTSNPGKVYDFGLQLYDFYSIIVSYNRINIIVTNT